MGGDGGAKAAAKQAQSDEIARQERVNYGTKQIRSQFDTAFDTPFYQKMEADARGVYKPQIQMQYGDAVKQLQAALARSGLSSSTQGVTMAGKLQDNLFNAKQQMRANIQNSINSRKQDVMNSENTALTQLQNSADPFAAQAQAANSIKVNSADQAFSPLGQVITDATAGLATQADMERQGTNRYNVGVTNWWRPNRSVATVG